MNTYYYYTRDEQNRPTTTHCFVTDGQTWARGTVRCYTDNPIKKEGKRKSYARAMKAFYEECNKHSKGDHYGPMFWTHEFMPELNSIEKKFMEEK